MFVVLCICSSMICVFAHCVDVQNDLCFQCMSVSLGLLYVVCVCCVCVCVWSDTCRQAKLLQLNTFYNWTNGNSSLHLDISLNFLALFEIPFGRASMYDVGHRRFMVEYFQNLCTRFMNGIGYDFAALHVALLVGILAKLVSDCHYIDDVKWNGAKAVPLSIHWLYQCQYFDCGLLWSEASMSACHTLDSPVQPGIWWN